MNFENFGVKKENKYQEGLQSLNQEALSLLVEVTPEDRVTFADLKKLEQSFFSQNN